MKKVSVLIVLAALLLPFVVQAAVAPVPQTGQTACYDLSGTSISCGSTGQDGSIRAGEAWPSPRFSDNGNQTMTDNLTGLIWTRDAGTPTVAVCSGGVKDWQSALTYVACLNQENYLGFNDWRLPNKNELASLINRDVVLPSNYLAAQGFSAVQSSYYWSGSTNAFFKNNAWAVDFINGYVGFSIKSGSDYVWPVRSGGVGALSLPQTGQTGCYDATGAPLACAGTGQDGELQTGAVWPIPRFIDNGNQSVTDTLTDLIWIRDPGAQVAPACGPAPGATGFPAALNYVACLNGQSYLGRTDWRLPNVNELATLVNTDQPDSSIWLNANNFANISSAAMYWTSTAAVPAGAANALSVDLYGGAIMANGKTNPLYLLPVAGGTVVPMDVVAPAVTSFTIPASSSSATVGVALSGSDNVAVTGYCVTQYPDPTACVWSTTSPVNYTFSGVATGAPTSVNLNAWVKDAAGNISPRGTATISLTLPPTSSISGFVSANGGTLGLAGIPVRVYNAATNQLAASATSGINGSYFVGGLAAGNYYVLFDASLQGYVRQYYGGQSELLSARQVILTPPNELYDINADVYQGGSIAGRVTSDGAAPIGGIKVTIYNAAGSIVTESVTDTNGAYTANGLPTGSYMVYFNGNAIWGGVFYNGKGDLASADPVHVTAPSMSNSIGAILPPAPVTLNWASTFHVTTGTGTEFDYLDAGIFTSLTTLTGMDLTVSGPNGFTYTFTDVDKYTYLAGNLAVQKQYAPGILQAGTYTFTLTDANGNKSYRVSTYAVPVTVPRVDTSTIHAQRDASGKYRFTWAPVNDSSRTWYYRLRINDSTGTPVYVSRRMMDTSDTISSPPADGTYQVRVEVHEAQSGDLTFNRSNSSYITLTASASDYDPQMATITNSGIFNRTDGAAGTLATEAVIYFSTPTTSVTLLELTGPGAFSYTFNLTADINGSTSFYKDFATPLAPGSYMFHAVINGRDHYAPVTLTTPAPFPAVDTATMQAEYADAAHTQVRFSWAPVSHTGMLYYRVTVKNATSNSTVFQPSASQSNSMTVATSVIGDPATLKWRVDTFDSIALNTRRNHHATSSIPLVVQRYAGGLTIGASRVTSRTMPGKTSDILFGLAANLAPGGTFSEVKITGPDAKTRDLLKERWYSGLFGGAYLHVESGPVLPGLYTLTVADSAGNRQTRYKYLPVEHPIAAVDTRTIKMNRESNGIRISWAPIVSDISVVYRLSLYAVNDLTGDGVMDSVYSATTNIDLNNDGSNETTTILPVASVVIPFAYLTSASPLMIGITANDSQGGLLTNNSSFATVFKYQGAGYDYSLILDADNDGYAADVDPNDADPAVYPFAPGIAAASGPQSVATPAGGVFTATQNVVLSSAPGTAIYFTTDGSAPTYPESASTQTYISPIAVNSSTTIRFFARDTTSGAVGGERSVTYTIDSGVPQSRAVPLGGVYPAGSEINRVTLAASKPGSIYFTQDGSDPIYPPPANGSTRVYIGPINMSNGGTLKFRSRDLAGNLEPVQTQIYSISTTALIVRATPAGGLYNTTPLAVTLAATNNASIYYTVDGVTVPDCSATGTQYTQSLSLQSDTTLQYIACQASGDKTAVSSESYTFDTITPSIVSAYPYQDAGDMALETSITISFNKTMNPASFPPPSRILKIGNLFIPATGGFDAGGTTLTVIPSAPLLNGTGYTISIAGGKDMAGNLLPSFNSNFTTLARTVTAVVPVVTLDTSSKAVISGNDVIASGVVTAKSVGSAGQAVVLLITRPDGGVESVMLTTGASGEFSSSLKGMLVQPGRYQIQAFVGGAASTLAPVSSDGITVTVMPVAGYAIIAQGSIPSSEGAVSYEKTLYRARQSLIARGFAAENIHMLDSTQPKIFTKLDLMQAILTWAKNKLLAQPAPLHIILADHGDVDTFYLDDETLTPAELADWITTLEGSLDAAALAQPRYITIGSCYSGTFLADIAKIGRIIITSASPNEQSFRGPAEPDGVRSGEYFLDQYYSFLKQGQSVHDAFNNAVVSINDYTRRGGTAGAGTDVALQTPLFSINGDVIGTTSVATGVEDNAPNTLYLGAGVDEAFNPGNMLPVERSAAISSIFIQSSVTSSTITMNGAAGQNAWFEVRAPSITASKVDNVDSKQLFANLPTVTMSETSSGVYSGTYSSFTESGSYNIIVHLQATSASTPNNNEIFSQAITLYKNRSGNTAPDAFTIKTPADTSAQKTALAFEWNPATDLENDAVSYTLVVSRNADLSSPSLVREGLTEPFALVSYADGLLDLSDYYWQVTAIDSYGASTASTISKFSTDNTNGGISYVTGTISNATSGAGISGATVSAGSQTTTTLANGRFILSVLPGSFNMTVTASGYTDSSINGLSAVAMRVTTQNIAMTQAAATSYAITTSYDAAMGFLDCPATLTAGVQGVCTPQPKTGYQLKSVAGCGGALAGASYTTAAASADCTVTATFGPLVIPKPGDCDANGIVTIAEVQSAINMFLGLKTVAGCVDTTGDNSVSIAEVQKTINSFLGL